jgi:FAD:protein FMN transferase
MLPADQLPPWLPALEELELETGAYVFRDECLLGTRAQFHLVARDFTSAQAAAHAARAEVDRLNAIFNTRDPHSEISRLNRSILHFASESLFEVVSSAERWRMESGGAYSGRLGRVVDEWERAIDAPPSRDYLARLARETEEAVVRLHRDTRAIEKPRVVEFALDGIAKGWIVDRAFEMAMCASGVYGALVDIGGDIRCGGRAPDSSGWRVGVSDPNLPFDNAPLVATTLLKNEAIATSGAGPRDREFNGRRYSTTLSPRDGWPIEHHVSATMIASTAADADALASAMLVATTEEAMAFADKLGLAARITAGDGSVAWSRVAQVDATPRKFISTESKNAIEGETKLWQPGWQALTTFTAPRRQLIRDPDFRSPYMAMWITDLDNKPIRTLILVGKQAEWQKDNYIWWEINRRETEKLISTRSMSTSGAGVYNVFWDGVDDQGRTVPAGKYLLHVETSRERGKHTYRSLALNFDEFKRFVEVLPPTEEGGGLRVSVDHY